MLNIPVGVFIQGANFQFLKEAISQDQPLFSFYLNVTELPGLGFL
jgi:hypothetical protein